MFLRGGCGIVFARQFSHSRRTVNENPVEHVFKNMNIREDNRSYRLPVFSSVTPLYPIERTNICTHKTPQSVLETNHSFIQTDMIWEYLPVLNKLLQIILTIGIGIVAGTLGIFSATEFVPHSVLFIFYVALPSLITKVSLNALL